MFVIACTIINTNYRSVVGVKTIGLCRHAGGDVRKTQVQRPRPVLAIRRVLLRRGNGSAPSVVSPTVHRADHQQFWRRALRMPQRRQGTLREGHAGRKWRRRRKQLTAVLPAVRKGAVPRETRANTRWIWVSFMCPFFKFLRNFYFHGHSKTI